MSAASPGRVVLAAAFAAALALAADQAKAAAGDARPGAGDARAANEHAAPPDTLAERVRACDACHGSEGRDTPDAYSPRIAGKPAGYLYNQLVGFRDGRRNYAPMVYLVQYMSDDYLRAIAGHFAALQLPHAPPPPAAAPPAVLERGRTLTTRGDPGRHVPACAECHGAMLTGVEPAVPALLGLPRDYLRAQLGAWRNGTMRSPPPDCMAEVAHRLAPEDVDAVAAWLSAQPLPADPRPAASLPHPPPLECGSVANVAR